MELKKSINTIFIVPTLGIDREKLRINGFLNGYSRDIDKEINYENSVYLLFRPPNMDRFKEFTDDEYDRTSSLIDDYDPCPKFVVLVYSLNPKFKEDFELIKQGKYSKTSQEFKALFPKIVKVIKKGVPREETSLQYQIFNKSDSLREYWESRIAMDFKDDMEVWNNFDLEKETLNIDRVKELI
jgi:hypothetical protein